MLGEEAELHVLHAADVAGAHCHHLRSDGKHVARLCQRQHILLHQLRRAFPHLDEVRLDGIALVTAAVPARQDAALKIYDTVFFPALLRQITGFRCHVVFLLALRRKCRRCCGNFGSRVYFTTLSQFCQISSGGFCRFRAENARKIPALSNSVECAMIHDGLELPRHTDKRMRFYGKSHQDKRAASPGRAENPLRNPSVYRR